MRFQRLPIGTVFVVLRTMDTDVRQMATREIEQQINELEASYTEAQNKGADVLTLSAIWKRIKELQNELKNRGQQ